MAEGKGKKAKRFGSVLCSIHGTEQPKGLKEWFVRTSIPVTRNDRKNRGCPLCRKANYE